MTTPHETSLLQDGEATLATQASELCADKVDRTLLTGSWKPLDDSTTLSTSILWRMSWE